MARRGPSHPLERLGRWNGTTFEPVAPRSIRGGNLRVMSHGWAPGLAPAVEASEGFLRVWDAAATTPEGGRFDRWYGPLAEAIVHHDPSSTVLAYTWIDQSATTSSKLRGGRSQLRTTAAGHALAVALREALDDPAPAIHLIGHSHGAKVVTVAAALLPEPPVQLTVFDSPENLLPIVGGALNDLSPYLRALPIGDTPGSTFVDNYPSRYGIRYGADRGLGEIVDVTLDPARFPLDESTNEHSYAWRWYLESARDVSSGVGFAWSVLNPDPAPPLDRELRHPVEGADGHPLTLEVATGATRGRRIAENISERAVSGEPGRITTARPVRRGLTWRRNGDQIAAINVRWLEGPQDASLVLKLNGTERWRSTRGWSDDDTRHGVIPIGSMRSGLGTYEMRLESPTPAAVEITPGVVRAVPVPIFDEYRSWLRLIAGLLLVAASTLFVMLFRRPRRRRRRRS